jgi:hypothetical protein
VELDIPHIHEAIAAVVPDRECIERSASGKPDYAWARDIAVNAPAL